MTDATIEAVHRKTRQRLMFTAIHLMLYFSFTLNWTRWGESLGGYLGETWLTGSLLMFVLLIVAFVALETIFLMISRWGAR
ncbi:MAG: hypothetical protein P8O91_05680 [Luminiphilus sp.]|nr:hypothetical protein [Luminiphilus sp.]